MKPKALWLAVLWLLVGAALRFADLGAMRAVLDYDEAFYGVNALSLRDAPRLVPFFPENNGRESLWMYTLLPALVILDAQPFALRLTAVLAGILTLAAVYALARELVSSEAAAWAVGGLAVLYWHVHLSHLAFRVILYPLLAALALAWLLRAWRRNRWRGWLAAGVAAGLLLYTYLSARLWLAVLALLLAGMVWRGRNRRGGALLAGAVALVIMLPLLAYLLTVPAAGERVQGVAAFSLPEVTYNTIMWLAAWLWQGSTYSFHNLPGRPILDGPLALLAAGGVLVLARQQRRAGALLALLLGVALLPSLLSVDAPHYLRAAGAVIVVAVVVGAGAAGLARAWPRWGTLLAVALLLLSAVFTRQDFARWYATLTWSPQFAERFDRIDTLFALLADYGYRPSPSSPPLYYRSSPRDGALVDFRLATWRTAEPGVYEFPGCVIGRPLPLRLVLPLEDAAGIPAAAWGQVTERARDPVTGRFGAGYAVYDVTAPDDVPVGTAGGALAVALARPLPARADPGAQLAVALRLTPLAALARPLTLFVHVYPADALTLLAQADVPVCPDFPPARWYPDHAGLVPVTLSLPPDLPPGTYRLAAGLYDSETFARLPLTDGDTVLLTTFSVPAAP